MTTAFVDTTVLTDAVLKPGPRARSALNAIQTFDRSELPVYAIKEFKAGPLSYYVWLHNKLSLTGSFRKTAEAIRRMAATPRRNLLRTALEALEAAANRRGQLSTGDLVQKYGATASVDRALADLYRLSLKSLVIGGWRKRRRVTSVVVQELSCYEEEDPRVSTVIELGKAKCNAAPECSLAAALKAKPEDLKKLRAAIPTGGRIEDARRSQALRQLIRRPGLPLDAKTCVHLGDAIFAFFAPAGSTILTTNVRDHGPLAESLGKTARSPE